MNKTFDTHLSMTTHKMGEHWFSEEVKFQCLRNTSGVAGSMHHLGIEPYQYDDTGPDEDNQGSERLGNNEVGCFL